MSVRKRQEFTKEQIAAGIHCLCSPIGFSYHIMGEQLRVPETRTDLPEWTRGHIVLTHEQRLMALDGASVALYRWRKPASAVGSYRIMMRTGRKTGKTTFGYKMRYAWYSTINPRGRTVEGLLHAPGQHHMNPVENQLESMFASSRLLSQLFEGHNLENGIWKWKTGISWHHRIEGSRVQDAGRAMVGLAVSYSLGDEGAYSSSGAYGERKQVTLPDAIEFWGGVPRAGEQGMFKTIADRTRSDLESGRTPQWSLHANPTSITSKLWQIPKRYSMFANILYHSDVAVRAQLGTDSWDSDIVLTQICGLDGEAGETAFPVVPTAPIPFYAVSLSANDVMTGAAESILSGIEWGQVQADEWCISCDYGFSPSPMETIVSYRVEDLWYEMARISALRCDTHDAARIIYVIDQSLPILPEKIIIDSHGQGRGLMDTLIKHPAYQGMEYGERAYPANFHTSLPDERIMVHKVCSTPVQEAEKDVLWFCEACGLHVPREAIKPINVQAKQLLTTDLIEAFQYAARRLAGTGVIEKGKYGIVLAVDDSDLTRELYGTVAVKQLTMTKFIPPDGQEHRTDALRCLAMGRRAQTRIETNIARGGNWMDEAGAYEIQPLYASTPNSGWAWAR
jgi:hypothetical protein